MANKKPLPTTPAFCFISPKELLSTTIGHDRHLVLAHLIHEELKLPSEDRTYTNFYRERSDRGDYIICDNSAFELGSSFDPRELIRLATIVGADALVLPDYPGEDHMKTIDAAKEWIPKFKAAGLDTFFVPQGVKGCLEGWITAFKWAAENPDIDIIGWSILGIPNALMNRGVPAAYARVVMANILMSRSDTRDLINNKYNHFLGLNSGPKLEVPALLALGILDSIDSSGPIWAAVNGHEYTNTTDSFMDINKAQLPHVDFDIRLVGLGDKTTIPELMERVSNNINMTNSLFLDSASDQTILDQIAAEKTSMQHLTDVVNDWRRNAKPFNPDITWPLDNNNKAWTHIVKSLESFNDEYNTKF